MLTTGPTVGEVVWPFMSTKTYTPFPKFLYHLSLNAYGCGSDLLDSHEQSHALQHQELFLDHLVDTADLLKTLALYPDIGLILAGDYNRIRDFGQWMTSYSWQEVYESDTVEENTTAFYSTLHSAIDKFFPQKRAKLHQADKPWITSSLKCLIHKRQLAHHQGHETLQRFL
ncbi:hypothetical protein Bbelb_290880 [Branchiostoma belcheri]|nr:hypothetical protein Bbelb_290880 [Branchiostoma belcheri]